MSVDLPSKCFISHSYADADAVGSLLKLLPSDVEPFVFPPITVSPHERVSDDLVQAILDCPGLIFLTGANSASSFWVTFERDYALRAGKKVFAYDSETRQLVPHREKPTDLPVFASFSPGDVKTVREIARFMKDDRHFDIYFDEFNMVSPYEGFSARLNRGGFCAAFLSRSALMTEWSASVLIRSAERR